MKRGPVQVSGCLLRLGFVLVSAGLDDEEPLVAISDPPSLQLLMVRI